MFRPQLLHCSRSVVVSLPSLASAQAQVSALGRLEPWHGTLMITAAPTPESTGGTVLGNLFVDRGDNVKAGQLLAVTESAGLKKAQVEEARADVEYQRRLADCRERRRHRHLRAGRCRCARLEAQAGSAGPQAHVTRRRRAGQGRCRCRAGLVPGRARLRQRYRGRSRVAAARLKAAMPHCSAPTSRRQSPAACFGPCAPGRNDRPAGNHRTRQG